MKYVSWLLRFLIAYGFLKLVSFKSGFTYDMFSDGFNLRKTSIDLGIYTIGYVGATLLLKFFKFEESYKDV